MKRFLARALGAAIGRRNLVRVGRLLLDEGRLDVPNDPSTNGEMLIQSAVLSRGSSGKRVVVADVGANVGAWTRSFLLRASRAAHEDVTVHAFEPDRTAFEMLAANLKVLPDSTRVVMHQAALSDRRGESVLYVTGGAAGTNSLYPRYGLEESVREVVMVNTLDAYAEKAGVSHFDLVKVDAEGHDLAVIRGARELLGRHAVGVLQFEYNRRWIDARCFLRDAFDQLVPLGYVVGKVTPRGVEFYDQWDPELETFREGNYLACRHDLSGMFPTIRWWNTPPAPR